MLESVKGYIYRRRNGLMTTVTFAGGLYLAKHYIQDRLEEVKVKLEQERAAQDSLRRRFQQTQEDVSYTILALIPTLSEQILDQMNIEVLTQELQNRSKARNSVRKQQLPVESSSLASSIVDLQDTRSDVESSVSHTSTSFDEVNPSSAMSHSVLQSWVESSGSQRSPVPSVADSSAASSTSEVHLSESMIHASNLNGENHSANDSGWSESIPSTAAASDSTDLRTKAELWNEVKMLTFTRTLTTLYSTTLLCLLTTLQLTLLARSKYISSVLQLEREERFQERLQSEFSITSILLGSGKGLESLMAGNISSILGEDGIPDADAISEESESKFLTLSWWLLHVGWKDVGERVRRGVEEVFSGVSLKTKLAAIDLHRLISDVRRRVEHEVTFEGNERRINFLSSLLPPTPETIQLVLSQGGYNPSTHQNAFALNSNTSLTSSQLSHQFNNSPAMGLSKMHHQTRTQPQPQGQPQFLPPLPPPTLQAQLLDDPGFSALIAETRTILSSSDFSRVLEVCLDTATEVLFAGLEKNVFVPNEPAPGDNVLRIRLAGLLPGLARWSQLALNGLPNELVDRIMDVREVSCFSAIVFAKFEERFQ